MSDKLKLNLKPLQRAKSKDHDTLGSIDYDNDEHLQPKFDPGVEVPRIRINKSPNIQIRKAIGLSPN